MFNWLFTKTPLIFLVQSFWRDEAFSYLMAKKSLLDIMISTAHDFSPPFYYFVLHFWISIFGKSEIALRSLSLIFYWATLYVAFLFLNDVFKMTLKKSFLYLLLFVINPLLVYYAFEVRMYSMFAFFSILSFYALYKKNSTLYLISSILGVYTHYFMLLVVLGQYVFFRYKQKLVFISFIPWMVFVLFNRSLGVQPFWINKFKFTHIFTFIGNLYSGYEYGSKLVDKIMTPLSVLLWIIIIFACLKRSKNHPAQQKLFKLIAVWGLVLPFFVVIVSYLKPIFLPRYLIFAVSGLIFLLIFSFERMSGFFKIFSLSLLVIMSLSFMKVEVLVRRKANFRKPIREIKNLMKKDDVLLVTSELDYFTAQYYLDEDRVFIYGKNYSEIQNYIGKVLIKEEAVVNKLPVYPKRAFVLNEWGGYDVQALY
ncbi:MAG: hypothetical protein UR63_C0039G0005 [Candidatus Roizmanbacteria bacterium GW2011_GWC2_35_12]|uniref:Uncharacterized protein n=2 Tax=Candidatus Roizmaniibacteriota TaxID=1752723 RepID=A0A0G0EF99_9BACT|nr:MAG: hypothetical protein UR63_C0039G0005 [Candidatus Roizmanbacteria bacterium GW2011_GWC2_35_12]